MRYLRYVGFLGLGVFLVGVVVAIARLAAGHGAQPGGYILGVGLIVFLLAQIALAVGRVTLSSKRRCPDCAELVASEARVCKHCGYRFGEKA